MIDPNRWGAAPPAVGSCQSAVSGGWAHAQDRVYLTIVEAESDVTVMEVEGR